MKENLWLISNLGIAGGYYVLALALYRLLAQFMVLNWQTKIGAFLFFAMCSLTHVEMALHVVSRDSARSVYQVSLQTHMLVIHAVQFGAVWLFIYGVLASQQWGRAIDVETAKRLHADIDSRTQGTNPS